MADIINYIISKFYSMKDGEETIYYDFETTGLNPFNNKVIEYAFLREDSSELISSLIDPETKFEKKHWFIRFNCFF